LRGADQLFSSIMTGIAFSIGGTRRGREELFANMAASLAELHTHKVQIDLNKPPPILHAARASERARECEGDSSSSLARLSLCNNRPVGRRRAALSTHTHTHTRSAGCSHGGKKECAAQAAHCESDSAGRRPNSPASQPAPEIIIK
jgi:hypothetical protein